MLGLCLHYFTWHENSHKNIFCDNLTWRAGEQWQDDMMTWQGWLDDDLPVWPPSLNWGLTPHCGGSLPCAAVRWLLLAVWCWRSAVVLRPATAVTTLRSNTDTAVARHIAGKSIADAALIIPEKGDLSLGEGPRTCFVQFPSFHKMSLEWVFCHFKPNHCWTLFRVTSYLKEF